MGFSTFGTSILIDFGFFGSEASASSLFGIAISLAGVIGTPVGGLLIDLFTKGMTVPQEILVVATRFAKSFFFF